MSVPQGPDALGETPDAAALLARLPGESRSLLADVLAESRRLGVSPYLVGGVVRDLVLGRPGTDLDVAVEGDALALASAVAARRQSRIVSHLQFRTATVYAGLSLDLATARTETYPHSGSLPVVSPGTIEQDLGRRDFTFNAMALPLSGEGTVLDPFGGLYDLRNGAVRFLHHQSFRDDATRMFRAIRYEQRFGFRLEGETEAALRRDVRMVDTISGERLRHELERIFEEDAPETHLSRAAQLGLLQATHPTLAWDTDSARAFSRARVGPPAQGGLPLAYVAVLTARMDPRDAGALAERLSFPGSWSHVAGHAIRLRALLERLEAPGRRSDVYRLLKPFAEEALLAWLAMLPGARASQWVRLYLDELAHVRPLLSGRDVLDAGVPQGPLVGEALAALTEARLDGLVHTRQEEAAFIEGWKRSHSGA